MKSLSGELLKKVLKVYLAISVSFSAVQLVTDYSKAKAEIFNEMNTALNAFSEPLKLTLWNMDLL